MEIKEVKRLKKLKYKYYDNDINISEYEAMVDLDMENNNDKYWDADGTTKW